MRAFAIVEQFHGQLINSKIRVLEDDAGQLSFSETVLLQVLIKLVQGLLKMYEYCKGNEMSSLISLQSSKKNDKIEGRFVGRFVGLVSIVMKKANNGDQRSHDSCVDKIQRNLGELIFLFWLVFCLILYTLKSF